MMLYKFNNLLSALFLHKLVGIDKLRILILN